MNYYGGNPTHMPRTGPSPTDHAIAAQNQSHLLAFTSEWGHSVFELNSARGHVGGHMVKHPAEVSYGKPNSREPIADEMKHNTNITYGKPGINWHVPQQNVQNTDSVVTSQYHTPDEEVQIEREEQCDSGQAASKDCRPQPLCLLSEEENPEESPQKVCDHKSETDDQNSDQSVITPERRLRCCHRGRLSEEEINAKRATQAAAQRDVRRRRRSKMSEEEIEDQRASIASAQREARKRQRERMSDEELQLRRTINAIAQREIRKRKHSKMTEEELKAHKAREAARQKELRLRRRMLMTEEELKAVKAKEAAQSAMRRARRLGKECTALCLTGQQPDPSPS